MIIHVVYHVAEAAAFSDVMVVRETSNTASETVQLINSCHWSVHKMHIAQPPREWPLIENSHLYLNKDYV